MTLRIDHIFVCASVEAPEAQALIDAGFVEGTRNVHPGQGTANRRFFFESGFLEFLWVSDQAEAQSELTSRTRLWERWSQRSTSASPFGLCFSSTEADEPPLPFDAWAYEPRYLPPGKRIYFAEATKLDEPALFALSWRQTKAAATAQPISHRMPMGTLRSVSVGLSQVGIPSRSLSAAIDAGLVRLHRSLRPELVVEFESPNVCRVELPDLGLTLVGQP